MSFFFFFKSALSELPENLFLPVRLGEPRAGQRGEDNRIFLRPSVTGQPAHGSGEDNRIFLRPSTPGQPAWLCGFPWGGCVEGAQPAGGRAPEGGPQRTIAQRAPEAGPAGPCCRGRWFIAGWFSLCRLQPAWDGLTPGLRGCLEMDLGTAVEMETPTKGSCCCCSRT